MREAVHITGGELFLPDNVEVEEFPRLDIEPREGYALLPFHEAFSGRDVLLSAHKTTGLPPGHHFYKVDFGSLRRPDVADETITGLDTAAHREAAASPGFGVYFRGDLDSLGHNRSFCVWRSVEDGALASAKPAHTAAINAVNDLYMWYQVTRHEMWLDDSVPLGYRMALLGQPYSSDGQLHIPV